jgi:hypothetical protein
MRLAKMALVLATSGLVAGFLIQLIPGHSSSSSTDNPSGSEVGGLPIYQYDMGHVYGKDPVSDGGTPVKFADIQAKFDSLGCTTATCHGATVVPVIYPKPTANQALLNYYDLLSGCANGAPDPSDCIDTTNAGNSELLAKTCATSGVMHMGGFPFKDDTDPTYVMWKGWIAAGAPY